MKKKIPTPPIDPVTPLMEKLSSILREHEEKQSIRYGGDISERLQHVLQEYNSVAVQALSGAKAFRDDVIVDLRAIVLYLETVGNGYTHKEKDARLRGLVELLEKQIHSLRTMELDFSRQWHRYDDVFRSDFPTRELMSRIYALEAENKDLKVAVEGKPKPLTLE